MAIKVANNNQALSFKVAGPQLPDSILGLTYKGTLTSADDLDDLVGYAYSGYYYITSSVPANAPSNATTYGILMVITNDSAFTIQVYIHPGVSGYYAYEMLAIRQRAGNPAAWRDWYSVKDMWANRPNTAIASNTDLNSLTAPGVYVCPSGAVAGTLTNSPYTQGIWEEPSGFRMEVITISSTYYIQRIVTHNANSRIYIRTCNSPSTFYNWADVTTTNIIRVNYKSENVAATTPTALAVDSSEVLKGFTPLTNATANNRYITVPAGVYRFSYQINTNPGSSGHARAWLSWSDTSSTPSTLASYALSVATGGYANNNFLGLNGTGVLKFTEASRVALVFYPLNNNSDATGPSSKPYMIIERL